MSGGPRLAAAVATVVLLAVPTSAAADESTRIVQGEHIRIASTADWDRMAELRPNEPVEWVLDVIVDAPSPGAVELGVRGAGSLGLVADVQTCEVAWREGVCSEGQETMRADWRLPLDGETDWLRRSDADDPLHVRLVVSLASATPTAETSDISVHVRAGGDDILLDWRDDPELTPTAAPVVPLLLAVGSVLAGVGLAALARGRRRSGGAG